MIYHKILETNLQGNKKQLEGRIDNQILGVKQFKITNSWQTADKQLTNKINLSNLRVIEVNKYEVPWFLC